MDYQTWLATVQQMGGLATVWPFADDNQGQPAARFTSAQWSKYFNLGQLPTTGTQASRDNQYIYVLATAQTGSAEVLQGAPQTMTVAQQAANAAFTAGDTAAGALGLPSLSSVETFLKDTGKQILIGVGIALAVAYLARSRR